MQSYRLINQKGPSSGKKLLIILAVIVGVILLLLGIVGLIRGSDSAEHQNVSAAIEENLNLKRKVQELQQEIADLQEQLAQMSEAISAMATPEPSSSIRYSQNSGMY